MAYAQECVEIVAWQQAAVLRCGKYARGQEVFGGVTAAQAWILGRIFPRVRLGRAVVMCVHDAVRKMGCEGSVSLAWRTGEG